ncbi:MAG: hypothetical protein JO271_15330 [Verrucomicrobia bacterium]|nr:hypothetical protein [Verrucomicrobiota bacterium]
MQFFSESRRVYSAILCVMALGWISCASYPRIPAAGDLAGKPITTTVDSSLAEYYLENSLEGDGNDPILNHQIAGIDDRYRGASLDRQTFKAISQTASPDFAALFLIKKLLSNPRNLKFQTNYLAETKRIKSDLKRNEWSEIVRPALRRYEVVFVPGFHYLTDRSSGADFANQRQFFRELGVRVRLIGTEEDGTVEQNAAIIAANIRAQPDANIILVSTSKAGPEVALALGKILPPEETTGVKAWISVGGLIRGTPLADFATTWPQSWIVRLMFLYSRTGFQGIPSLTTTASQTRMEHIRIPARILVIEYVAAPLSGDIYGSVSSRYIRLRKGGPNDGLTLLADELLPNSIAVIEPGIDHFYAAPDIVVKSVALANVVAESITREFHSCLSSSSSSSSRGIGVLEFWSTGEFHR